MIFTITLWNNITLFHFIKNLIDQRYVLITELLKHGVEKFALKFMTYITIIPIFFQMKDKEIKYLSQYLKPVSLILDPVLLTNIPYTIGKMTLGPEALREKFRLCKSTLYGPGQ